MKISLEIKEDKLIYEYEVNKSKEHGYIELNTEHLIFFTETLKRCQEMWKINNDMIIRKKIKELCTEE